MEERKNILIIAVNVERFGEIAPILQRRQFDVDRFPGPKGALELVSVVPFRALILGFPMSQVPIDDFLKVVHHPRSASREAAIAMISSPEHLPAAQAYLEKGIRLVASFADPPHEVESKLCSLLSIKARRAFRLMVTLNVTLEDAKRDKFVAQTKDISASGMFVQTNREVPVGTKAFFEFALPTDPKPFCGEAEVVRISKSSMGRIDGLGLRFNSFIRNTPARLQECLEEYEL